MKKYTFALLTIFLIIACSQNKKDKLLGTWYNSSVEENFSPKDTVRRFIEYADNKETSTLYTTNGSDWEYFKGISWYLGNTEQINFISNDKFEILLPDSVKKFVGLKENPVYNRVKKTIAPNKMIFDLYTNFYPFGNSLSIDTLGDETIYYNYVLTESKDKSMSTLEHQIKYFIDKQMKSLPKKEELLKYDELYKSLVNIYTWEDLNSKILMECYFKNKDTTDQYKFNDKDELEVKIWQNIK